ncbi:MAG TPA: ABC transporter ATP-binding protein [Gemmatimonadales bacterium]|nr:ABC transporter ATP-binding protein [Gemmatimonadales bacterium]
MTTLLDLQHLQVRFPRRDAAPLTPVDDVSFAIARGELVALVGESGCGKSLSGLAIPGLLPEGAALGERTAIVFDGTDLAQLDERALRPFRGARIAMVFQDPMSSLNPVMRVGAQVIEAIQAHQPVPAAAARERAIALFTEVGIADPAARIDAYPHQMSGGMRQRVMLAMALAAEPELLIADEPTTALDVTVQAQILELLDTLRRARGMAVLLITHDLGIVAGRADRVLVMYAGRLVESAPTASLFSAPRHPYTQGLFASIPRLDADDGRLVPIAGAVPPPERWPSGCRFHPRCPVALARCRDEQPALLPVAPAHHAACWVALEGR